MEQVTNLGEVRKKKKRKKVLRAVAVIVLILAVTYGAAVVMNHPDYMGPASLFTMFQSGGGYPVEAPGGKSKGLYTAANNLVVVNDTDLFMYNASGSQIFTVKHRMANPMAQSAGNFLLIYDRGGKSYNLYNRITPSVDGKTENPIYAGATAADGTFVIASRSEDYLSQVVVYSHNGQEKYSWNYSDKMVTNVALSPSGENMAVAALYAQDGILYSQLAIYRKGELAASRSFENEVMCHLLFAEEDRITGITDATAFSIDSKGKMLGEYHYQGQSLSAFAATENSTALLLGSYQQNVGYDMVSLTQDMLKQSAAKVQGTVHKMCADGTSAYILAGNKFFQYDLETGALKGEVLADYVYDIVPMGKYVYAITSEEITRAVKEDISQWQEKQEAPQEEAEPLEGEDNAAPEGENTLPDEAVPPEQQDAQEQPQNTPQEGEGDAANDTPENSAGEDDEGENETELQPQKPQGAPGL